MSRSQQRWVIKDKRKLLVATMSLLAGDASISFEGDLAGLKLAGLANAHGAETATLKRNTLWPKQDFVVLPLEPDAIMGIMAAVGGTVPRAILHIQIEKSGHLQFGIYDNDSVFFGPALSESFLDGLSSQRIIWEQVPSSGR